tara:strand:+ start:21734 stop:24133 length:2400 start_codon:yes stop_codon:yes gene_type:complete
MSVGKGDFEKAHKLSAGNEGGISSDTADTGNYLEIEGNEELSKVFVATRYGQTFGNWLSANGRSTPSNKASFDKLAKEFGKETKEDVSASFKKQYWTKYNLDDIADADVASNVYDAMINQTYTLGGGGEQKTLANVLTELGYEVDANKDFSTNKIAITALNKAIEEKGAEEVNTAYSNQREKSYMGSGTVPTHGKGWLKRLNLYREDEDQYSKEDLDGMVFTNDSTSNQAVLTDLRTSTGQVAGTSETFEVDEGGEESKSSKIKNKSNLDYLRRNAIRGEYELEESDLELINTTAENQRIEWSKLGTPSVSDLILNASGFPTKLGVDDDASNAVMRKQVIEALSEGIDVNTAEGKKQLRQRVKAYSEHVKSDEYQADLTARNDGARDTSYQNMTDDLSFDYRTLMVEANEFHGLEGSESIGYETSELAPDTEGVLSDNKAIINEAIKGGDTDLQERVAKEGITEVATQLTIAQKESAERGDDYAPATTLLAMQAKEEEMAVQKKAMKEGVDGLEAIEFEDDEEDEESMESLGLNEDGTSKVKVNEKKGKTDAEKEERRGRRMKTAEKVLTGLKAAAGLVSLSKALRDPEVDVPELSPLIMEAVDKQRQLSKSGLTSAEKGAAMSNLNNAYAGAMKNVLRASGGQRGLFLANQGTVDANRIAGLNQLAAQDATLHRQNIQQYNQLATSVGQMKLQRDMTVEQMKQSTMANNRQTLAGIGTNLVSEALSDVSWYMNPNRDLIEQAQSESLKNLVGKDGNKVDTEDWDTFSVGNANVNANTDKKTQAEKDLEKANANANKPN